MDLHHLRCFVAAAEELHFGRAAQRLDMLPSALGRFIRLLEDDLGTRLMTRTTRSVALTDDGAVLLKEARALLAQADALAGRFRTRGRKRAAVIRVGAIDSAAAGLLPRLLHDFRKRRPDVTVQLVEEKTVRLLPRLLSGRLDLAFVRPPDAARQAAGVSVPAARDRRRRGCRASSAGIAQARHHRRSRKPAADRARTPLAAAQPRSHHETVRRSRARGARRADRRREADHRQSGLGRVGRRHRPALDLAHGNARRPLHPACSLRHEQAAAGGRLSPAAPAIPCATTCWKC